MRFYQSWQQLKALTTTDFLHCLDILESFYVRRSICDLPTNGLNKLILELCQNFSDTDVVAWLRDKLLRGSGGRRWPEDEETSAALVTNYIYKRPIARYLLVAFEDCYEHKEPVNATRATIEHIMPQTLSEAWRKELGPEYDVLHERWLDTIGNLTLTGYNSELSNKSFKEKRTASMYYAL
jgi:hypothetical protein